MHIGQGYRAGFHALFSNPDAEVASQYVVYRDGSIEQWTDETDAAWHAGQLRSPDPRLAMEGRSANRLFLGIEHEGFTGEPFTEEMVLADLWLLHPIGRRYGIAWNADNLIGHGRLDSITRRNCPGTGIPLDWMLSQLAEGV